MKENPFIKKSLMTNEMLSRYVKTLVKKVPTLGKEDKVLLVALGDERVVRAFKRHLGVKKVYVVCEQGDTTVYYDDSCEVVGVLNGTSVEFYRTCVEYGDMKFDCVIANPPFSVPGINNLHLRVIESIINSGYLADGWCISTLQPVSWLLRNIDVYENRGDFNRFKCILDKTDSIEYLSKTTSCDSFGIAIRGALGVYCLKNNVSDHENVISRFREEFGNVDDTGFFEKVVMACRSGKHPSFGDVIETYEGNCKYYVGWSRIHGNPDRRDYYDLMSPDKKVVREGAKKGKTIIKFASEEEAENFRRSVVDGVFYKYASWCYKTGIDVCKGNYPWMGEAINPRTGIVGYKGEWKDEDLFAYFGLNEEAQEKAKTRLGL